MAGSSGDLCRMIVGRDGFATLTLDLFSRDPNPAPCSYSRATKRLRVGGAAPEAVAANEEWHNLFDSLSDEILFLILDRLETEPLAKKSFSLVCKSFYGAESRHRRSLTPLRSDLVPAALARYPSVSRLDLSLCPRVTDATLVPVGGILRSSLRSIDLSRSRGFSNIGIESVVVNCVNLVEINLSNAMDLSDAAAAAIGRARNLERLWLARCKMVTDMGIGCIAVGCQKLKLLCLKWCLGISDLGVGLVAVKCKQLRSLDLSFMPLHSNHDDPLAAATSNGLCALVVNPQGYQCQEFEVITEDGYILTMHRIPQGRGGGGGGDHLERRQPVLLQHGLLVDGMQWILNSPQQSLAFVLADGGFDVWISHIRGTRWSRRHVSLDPSSAAYWSWSWDELAAYELPATVGLVFNQTGQKLHYVGHSMGTLIALSSLSEGKLVDKLKSAALLSPVAYLSHMETPLGILAAKTFTGEILKRLGLAEFKPKGKIVEKLLDPFCRLPGVSCFDYMTSITGINCCLNASSIELFLQYEPQPTSLKTMIHFAQTYRDGVIRKYDYQSSAVNMGQYGESEPPAYNMANIPQDFPLFLSYGGEDLLSDVKDVTLLLDDLKHHDEGKLTVQFVKDYAHADFVIGVNAKSVVYDGMIAFFHRHYLVEN